MKLRLLALALTIGCLYSCSSARKAQTNDDVYYSSGNQEDNSSGGYVANDGSDDRIQSNSTGDNYNQYAYGDDYAPFSTCISPFWGAGFGMSPYYNPYFAYGYSSLWLRLWRRFWLDTRFTMGAILPTTVAIITPTIPATDTLQNPLPEPLLISPTGLPP